MIWRDSLSDIIANSVRVDLNAMFDAGSTLNLFAGTMPASLDDADAGTLIWSAPLNDPPFDFAVDSPYYVPMDITGMNALTIIGALGTITYWRMKTNAGAVQSQGTCGTSGSDINFAPTNVITIRRNITITQFRVMLDMVEFEN